MKSMKLALIVFYLTLSIKDGSSAPKYERSMRQKSYCGRTLFTGHKGFIASHVDFGRRMYKRSHECIWRIQTVPNKRIVLFPTFMSLEYAANCAFDSLDVFDGVNETAARIGIVCGGNVKPMFVSSGSQMAMKFRADSSISKEGFSLRYLSIPATSQNPGSYIVRRNDRNCTNREIKCRNGLCTPREMVCDKFDDCGDETDEKNCVHATNDTCGPAHFLCGRRDKCIPNHMKCDGFTDCYNRNDEKFCGPDGIFSPTDDPEDFDPTERINGTCGNSIIAPKLDDGRVIGGQVARRGSWPWIVSLHDTSGHVCGGSILSQDWVLTAAHCVEGSENPSGWKVIGGLHRQGYSDGPIQIRRVSQILVHPSWDKKNINYDLALLRLSAAFNWTRYILPVCLPSTPVDPNTQCYILGWGETKGTGGAGRLKQGRVRTFNNSQCDEWYGGAITDEMVCAGRQEGGVDSCQGDSGGPLVCEEGGQFVLHGVTSFGGECGAPNSPGVYARVTSMQTWIQDSMDLDTNQLNSTHYNP